MSQYFDTFLGDVEATSHPNPDALPEQPDVMADYRLRVNIYGDIKAVGTSDSLTAAIQPTGVLPGVYTRVRVNAKGQVVEGLADNEFNYTKLDWNAFLNTPSTLFGFGITDAYTKAETRAYVADAVAAAVAAVPAVVAKSWRFSTKSMMWRVKHNMGTTHFHATIQNQEGEIVYTGIEVIDDSEFRLMYTSPESGTLDVVFYLGT